MGDPDENGRYIEQSHICNVDSYPGKVEKGEDSKFKNRNMIGKKNTVMKAGHKKGCNYNNLKEREKKMEDKYCDVFMDSMVDTDGIVRSKTFKMSGLENRSSIRDILNNSWGEE